MDIQALLREFIELLKEENRYLIQSISDKRASDELIETVRKKEELLRQILALEPEDVKPYLKDLEQIDHWTQRNRALAINNIEFINEIFDAIYSKDTPTQYTKDGTISNKKEGFFNKKA